MSRQFLLIVDQSQGCKGSERLIGEIAYGTAGGRRSVTPWSIDSSMMLEETEYSIRGSKGLLKT